MLHTAYSQIPRVLNLVALLLIAMLRLDWAVLNPTQTTNRGWNLEHVILHASSVENHLYQLETNSEEQEVKDRNKIDMLISVS